MQARVASVLFWTVLLFVIIGGATGTVVGSSDLAGDSHPVEIAGHGDTTDDFESGDTAGDAGNRTPVDADEADLQIQSLDYPSAVAPGETLLVNYTVENAGTSYGTESFIRLRVGGERVDSDYDIGLPAGATETGTLTADTDSYQEGETIGFEVLLADTNRNKTGGTTVAVPSEPILEVGSVEAPRFVSPGNNMTINYTIRNLGGEAGTANAVDLLAGGESVDSDQQVTVPAEGTAQGTLVLDVGTAADLLGAERAEDRSRGRAQDRKTGVDIGPELREASGLTEVFVGFRNAESAASPAGLRAHASEVREPLVRFAGRTPGVTIERTFWLTPAALVTVNLDEVGLTKLTALKGVESVSPNTKFHTTASRARTAPVEPDGLRPADHGDHTYGVEQIDAPSVWEQYGTQGEGASVAVLDTGADPGHPDIDVARWAEFDQNGDPVDSQPQDYKYHGTHVSGTVTGGAAGGTHIGVAPGADLYHAAVLTYNCNAGCIGYLSQIVAGMEWAIDQNADVISMSLGSSGSSTPYLDAVLNAESVGVPVVASAGNDGVGVSGTPGSIYETLSVGAVDETGAVATFSSGERVDTDEVWGSDAPQGWPDRYVVPRVSAPGVEVLSAVSGFDFDYGYLSGTSMAAPHVSGAIALVESTIDRDIDPETLRNWFEWSADKPGEMRAGSSVRDRRYGAGILNVSRAIEYLKNVPPGEFVDFSVALSSGDAASGRTFIEGDPASFAVTSVDAPDTAEGEALTVTASIENTGTLGGTQTVTLDVPGLGSNDASVKLDGRTATEVSLAVPTSEGDAGGYTATVSTENDSASTGATVLAPAEFTVDIVGTTTPVAGENLTVTASIENVGQATGTETVTLTAGGLGETATNVTLAGGNTTERGLSIVTGEGDAGEYTATVTAANDSASTTVTVDAPAESALTALDIAGAGGNATLTEGEGANVSVVVENIGDISGSFDVTLDIGTVVTQTQTTGTLPGGATETVRFENVTAGLADGTYSVTVSTTDDQQSGELTVEPATGMWFPDQNTTDQTEAVLENVSSDGEAMAVVTYETDGQETVAGTATGTFGGENVTVALESYIGFPAEYTAHLVPTAEISGNYTPGETLPANATDAALVTASANVTTVTGAPEIVIGEGTAKDTTGDGLLNDVLGTGSFNIFDVQVLFTSKEAITNQGNAEYFNFQGSNPDEVTTFDVQALFTLYQEIG